MWFPLTILSALGYSLSNVGCSTLVARFHKSPVFLIWVQTFVSMIFLLIIALFYDVRTSWAFGIMVVGVIAYGGDLLFFWILDRLDVSVLNAAWAIQTVYVSIVGFLFFHESWNAVQGIGASLVLIGVCLLSFFTRQVTFRKSLYLLGLLALCFAPVNIMRKVVFMDGVQTIPFIFWMLLGRDGLAFFGPLLIPSQRRKIFQTLPTCSPTFFVLSAAVISCFFVAEFLLASAYRLGQVSLISVVGNIQPFFVVFLAGLLALFIPSLAAKELFSRRSLIVKLGSFSIVFIGLALLGAST
ncbi:MAG: EamA family transporter [Candidatus Peribacteraceae bacterium]|nr:EamA family transporter [Candidatus Peribacteraceae bacterium]